MALNQLNTVMLQEMMRKCKINKQVFLEKFLKIKISLHIYICNNLQTIEIFKIMISDFNNYVTK